MVELLDFRQEARGCLRLAETEAQAEVKTILMGMALGWLTLANQAKPSVDLLEDPADDLADDLAEEPVDEMA